MPVKYIKYAGNKVNNGSTLDCMFHKEPLSIGNVELPFMQV